MENIWKIHMLAFISFFVSTSEYVIAGILDQIVAWANISVSAAGQLITVFAIANALGSPLFVMATTKMDRRQIKAESGTTRKKTVNGLILSNVCGKRQVFRLKL